MTDVINGTENRFNTDYLRIVAETTELLNKTSMYKPGECVKLDNKNGYKNKKQKKGYCSPI